MEFSVHTYLLFYCSTMKHVNIGSHRRILNVLHLKKYALFYNAHSDSPLLGPIHMHKIYTCKYFASWSKHTHVSKSIFNPRSHANSVHISILKGTRTCCTAGMYRLLMTAAILFVHWSCT